MRALKNTARRMIVMPIDCVDLGTKPSIEKFNNNTIIGLAEHMTFTKLVIGYANASFMKKIPVD